MNASELAALQTRLAGAPPRAVLQTAFECFPALTLSFSGAEDVVLIDMACRIKDGVRVLTLDTGRLHPETYRFIEDVRGRYPIDLCVLSPDATELADLVRAKGLFSFYTDGHGECCGIRKVVPLRRALAGVDAWATGQRRDQSAATRQSLPEVQCDAAFATEDHPLIKFNPLAGWTLAQVWDYIAVWDVPFNPLHRRGFVSIGCEPCTRAPLPGQHERTGRWWWEDATKKECGLHAGNLTTDPG